MRGILCKNIRATGLRCIPPIIVPHGRAMSTAEIWNQTPGFKNRYFIIRHGESEANKAGIVSSTFRISVANHGLTEKGAEQARSSAAALFELASKPAAHVDILGNPTLSCSSALLQAPSDVLFYTSDFARAYETAYGCMSSLKSLINVSEDPSAKRPPITLFTTPHLRERSFGDFEGADHTIYHQVWEKDIEFDSNSNHFNVESIKQVIDRTTGLILELEQTWSDKVIVLVSHGDVCQILQTAFLKMDHRKHRSLPHMHNCDVRELQLVKTPYTPQ